MKNIARALLFWFIAFFISFGYASAIVENTNSSELSEFQCTWAYVTNSIYINWDSKAQYISDQFFSTEDILVSNPRSEVSLWSSDSNLVSCDPWTRPSSVSQPYPWVVALWANCTFNKPTNPDNRTLQFVYNVGYYEIDSGTQTIETGFYRTPNDIRNGNLELKTFNLLR